MNDDDKFVAIVVCFIMAMVGIACLLEAIKVKKLDKDGNKTSERDYVKTVGYSILFIIFISPAIVGIFALIHDINRKKNMYK